MRSTIKALVAASTLCIALGSPFAMAQNKDSVKTKSAAPAKDNFKDKEVCPKPEKLMTGWYLGAQLGYDAYRYRQTIRTPSTSSLVGSPAFSANGWVGGLTLGYGEYLSDWFYMAGEVFGNVSSANTDMTLADGSVSYNNKIDATGSFGLALLPGAKLNDAALGYLRLGWTWVNMKSSEDITGGASTSKTNTSNGFNMGVGIETLISGHWSVRTEYNHMFLSSFRTNFDSVFEPSDNQFLVGLLYHFD